MRIFSVILLLFLQTVLFAQIPSAYSFSEQTNLSAKSTYFLYEDSKRNMWFGTNNGLIRWNGYQLKTFKNNNYSSSYSSIQEDKEGRIWCQNFTGQVFYVEQDSFYLFTNESESVTTQLDYTIAYFPEIYISTDFGIIIKSFLTQEKSRISINPLKNHPTKLILDNGDTVYYEPIRGLKAFEKGLVFMNQGNLCYLDPNSEKHQVLTHYRKKSQEPPSFFELNGQILFVANEILKNDVRPVFSYYVNDAIKDVASDLTSDLNTDAFYYDSNKNIF